LRRALLTAVVVLAFFGLTSSASPRGGIVLIRGADAGSHLRLTVSSGELLVNGQLAAEVPSGCRLAPGYSAASCGLAEISSVVIEMGSANDKITVLDPLPVPLTAYLGSGSDKLIGNTEDDTRRVTAASATVATTSASPGRPTPTASAAPATTTAKRPVAAMAVGEARAGTNA